MHGALLVILYLLASPKAKGKGRQRYDPKVQHREQQKKIDDPKPNVPIAPPPLLTDAQGPYPTYFTCRHTYEDALMDELTKKIQYLETSSPLPGLVRVEQYKPMEYLIDPVYALQVLPECRILQVNESIKGLARAVTEIPEFQHPLMNTPRDRLSIHALVPGMMKGQKNPNLQRRALLLAEATREILSSLYKSTRRQDQYQQEEKATIEEKEKEGEDPWLLQLMLFSPDVVAASLTQCRHIQNFPNCRWPNRHYPLGLANVDIDFPMPSSAYRKLLEAFACWGTKPSRGQVVVDLGASPGGWTAALIHICQCRSIIAVDRSEMDVRMKNNLLVTFVAGDAFAYQPHLSPSVDWMMSDIIAYPERMIGLLDKWCSGHWAKHMIVTIKFQGITPNWDALHTAIEVVQSHGYHARAKHFFNNKNEVTLMIQGKEPLVETCRGIKPIYPIG
jgi:23S rRNA U2552 (ribose-2'-O)-methylase RlmE/FtsJ